MFDIVRWPRNPWSIFDELETLQSDIDRAFGAGRWRGRRERTYPLLNVWSSDAGVLVDAELPGADPQDVDISVVGDTLTVEGKVNVTDPPEAEAYLRRERPYGTFVRTLKLPFRADTAKVKASYKNGLLRISVPRSEEEKPRKIAIEA
jgi:HSP20 family protein